MSDHICGFICKNPGCERNNEIDDTFQFPAELEDSYPCVQCGWINELDNEIRFNGSSRVRKILKINAAHPPS